MDEDNSGNPSLNCLSCPWLMEGVFQSTSMKSLSKKYSKLEKIKKSVLSALLQNNENENKNEDENPPDHHNESKFNDPEIFRSKKAAGSKMKKIKSIVLDFYSLQPPRGNRKDDQIGDIDFTYVRCANTNAFLFCSCFRLISI